MDSRSFRQCVARGLAVILVLGAATLPAAAQSPPAGPAPAAEEMIPLELPDELELKYLAEVVSKQLGINLMYDERILGKRITIRAPKAVTPAELMALFESALQMRGMALVDAGRPGWKKVVPTDALPAFSTTRPVGAADGQEGVPQSQMAVSQVFVLNHVDPTRAVEVVRPFLTQPGGNIVTMPGSRQVIVSDFLPVVQRAGEILRWLDEGDPAIVTRFISLQRADAAMVLPTIQSVLLGKDRTAYGGTGNGMFVAADTRTNQIIVVGSATLVEEAAALVASLDKPVDAVTKVYRFKSVDADRVDRLFKGLLGSGAEKQAYRSAVDSGSGALVATAPPALHEQLAAVVAELDMPAQQSPIQFYKLKNTKAEDVLEVIGGIEDVGSGNAVAGEVETPSPGASTSSPPGAIVPAAAPPAAPQGAPNPFQPPHSPPVNVPRVQPTEADPRGVDQQAAPQQNSSGTNATERTLGYAPADSTSDAQASEKPIRPVRARNAIITADPHTNSIIVVAPPGIQAIYSELIRQLDQRRPQVMVECTIVALDTSDNFSLGVDIGAVTSAGAGGEDQLLTFSTFGLSRIQRGRLEPIISQGANVALLSPDIADIVLRALAGNARSKLVSMPQVLVNDNQKGELQSETEIQTLVTTDRDTGVTTQSVGQPLKAGTTVVVTPSIAEADYLLLDYEIELSSFAQQRSPQLPPDRQTNNIRSSVTVPDGHTIVVGGLSLKNWSESESGIPFLKDIPIIEHLFSSRTMERSDTTLFVFIRPAILRDDKFKDLKFYSDRKLKDAGRPAQYPSSEPLPVY